jgi:hypothetical protein
VPVSASRLVTHKFGSAEDLQMLRHGRPAQIEMASQIAGGTRPVCQQLEQLSPHRVGQGEEHVVGHATQITSDIPDMSTIPDASTPITVAPPAAAIPRADAWRDESSEALFAPRGPHTSRTARNVSRAIPAPRMGEALFGARTYTPTHRLTRPENVANPRLATFRERARPHAWAKPCLAGPHGARTAPNVPTRNPDLHVGEALFGGPTHGARTNAVLRDEHLA